MLLVLAMVMAAAVTHAWENGKARSAARWEEAKRRASEASARRDQEKQRRADEWEKRFDQAVSKGPRHPLWWAYAAGYIAGGAVAAIGAGAVGAYSGAIAGGKAGHRIGLEAGRQGRKFGDAWQEWRGQRSKDRPVELAQCQRCKGWLTAIQLTNTAEFGQVCPDCVPVGKEPPPWDGDEPEPQEDIVHERRPGDELPPHCANRCGMRAASGSDLCALCQILRLNQWEREAEERARQAQGCDGKCRNSNLSPSEAKQRGLCPDCGGRGELVTDFGGMHKHVTCRRCEGSGKWKRPGGAREKFVTRCGCGAPAVAGRFMCSKCLEQHKKAEEAKKQQETEEQNQGPIRVTAERIYPEKENDSTPKEIKNMTALEPARANDVDSSGEGYSTTASSLEGLVSLLSQVSSRLTELNEQLTSNSLDVDTLSKLSDLTDEIESVEENAKALHTHVTTRHEPVASAVGEAGGSQNVATPTWYDNY